MMKWLRDKGDLARLDQELRRFGLSSSALPRGLCEEIVLIVQRYFDGLRSQTFLRPSTSDLQVLFNDAFALGAAVPVVVLMQKEAAIKAMRGDYMYNEIASALNGEDSVYPETLVTELASATKRAVTKSA